jgi:hypothetical protein
MTFVASGMPIAKWLAGGKNMRKLLIGSICLLALIFAAIPVGAQTRARRNSNTGYISRYDQQTSTRYDTRNRDSRNRYDVYNNSGYTNYANSRYGRDDSFWEQHRDKITTAGGAAAGAILGSIVGGKRGALIGAIAGGGGAALYTYKIRQ